MNSASIYADQAVFILQLPTKDAIRYIAKNAEVDFKVAQGAFYSALTFHKTK